MLLSAIEAPIELGAILDGRYRVDAVLGSGGMGIVFLGEHLQLRQRVAIKMPLRNAAADPSVVERLLREGRAAVRLRSDHVCRVLDVGSTDTGLPFVVLEYLEGAALSDRLRKKQTLPLDEVWRVMLEICEAVGEAHRLGIVHRDLKPQNVFLVRSATGHRRAKVMDFGISRLDDGEEADQRLTQSSVLLGSPSYVAPEQMSDTRSADARADVWGLGVCAYEMLTGRRPFVGASIMDLAVRIARDPVEPPSVLRPDVPPALEAIVLRCLEKAPEDRYPSANELGAALLAAAPTEMASELSRLRPEGGRASSIGLKVASVQTTEHDWTPSPVRTEEIPLAAPPLLVATVPDPPSHSAERSLPDLFSADEVAADEVAADEKEPTPRRERRRSVVLVPVAAAVVLVVLGGALAVGRLLAAGPPAGMREPTSAAHDGAREAATVTPAAAGVAATAATASAEPAAPLVGSAPVTPGATPPSARAPSARPPPFHARPARSATPASAPDDDAIPRVR